MLNNKKKLLEYFFLFIIIIISSSFDLFTLLFALSLLLVSYFNFGIETSFKNSTSTKEKHGINEKRSSRLGGIIILFFIIINLLFENNLNLIINESEKLTFYIIIIFFISFLGLADDVLNGINYGVKLYFLFFSILILIFTNNEFLVNSSEIYFLDYFLNNYIFSFVITFFIISGFINASNMADGANGILSGIAFCFCLILFLHTNELIFFILFKFLFIFFLYNILISNVFLGDTGSYFLGFIISTISLYYFNNNQISAGFFACTLSYPCLEIIFSIFRRLKLRQNPFKPDNQHLHNLIFIFLKKNFKKFNYTNSLTGITINLLFVLPSFIYYLYCRDINDIYFWYIFAFHVFVYFFSYTFILQQKTNNNID